MAQKIDSIRASQKVCGQDGLLYPGCCPHVVQQKEVEAILLTPCDVDDPRSQH